MLRRLLRSSSQTSHLARSHLFLSSRSGLQRGRYWPEAMAADVLVYDYQDGCPPGEDINVSKSIGLSDKIFPRSVCSVRVSELGLNMESKIYEEIRTSLSQPQCRWLMLPMCGDSSDVQTYTDIINDVDSSWLEQHGQIQIIIETPWGLKKLDDMFSDHPSIAAAIVGQGDYSRFAQMNGEKLFDFLRWEVLNACLRHDRFPIDGPTVGITIADADHHYASGYDAGFRSSVVLHPTQVEGCHETFTPPAGIIQENVPKVDSWLYKRCTGYQRGSGDRFVGPPHVKIMLWETKYASEIAFRQRMMHQTQPQIMQQIVDICNSLPSAGSLLEPMLPFLAYGVSNHSDHTRLLANFGVYHCKWAGGTVQSPAETSRIVTSVLDQRRTQAGKCIITYSVDILDKNHNTQMSFIFKLLEDNVLPDLLFETIDVNSDGTVSVEDLDFALCEGDEQYTPELRDKIVSLRDELKTSGKQGVGWAEFYKRVKDGSSSSDMLIPEHVTLMNIEARLGQVVVSEQAVNSPSLHSHSLFCNLMGYDAPLHHTTDPTIPSTLHLSCHQIFCSNSESSGCHHLELRDVTYHEKMKPEKQLSSTIYDDISQTGSYISVLRAISEDGTSEILSTVSFFTEARLCHSEEAA